jgi:pyrimidine operon attenuation protein/uracil phosphoribosyltransferase
MSTLHLNAEALYTDLVSGVRGLLQPNTALVGIWSGGAWLAERLHAMMGIAEPLGLMDIAFYRDDYHAQGLHHDPKRTRIPFDVNGRDLLLVDDILYTGRTVRAAMNELFDYGRPASISLVVLADRGGRQLPICAQHCGARIEVPSGMRVRLKRGAKGELALELEAARAA